MSGILGWEEAPALRGSPPLDSGFRRSDELGVYFRTNYEVGDGNHYGLAKVAFGR